MGSVVNDFTAQIDAPDPNNPGNVIKKTVTYNNNFASDGSRELDGFVVTFDRPVDVNSFTATQVKVQYRSPTTPASQPGTAIAVGSVIPLDFLTGLPSQCTFIEPGKSLYLIVSGEVQVADNGTPGWTATQSFSVTVLRPAQPAIGFTQFNGGQFGMQVNGDAGPDYNIYVTTDLAAGPAGWRWLLTTNPAVFPFQLVDPAASNFSQGFYRVLLGP